MFKKIPAPRPHPPNHAKATSDLKSESTNNLPLATYPTFDYRLKSLIDTLTHILDIGVLGYIGIV